MVKKESAARTAVFSNRLCSIQPVAHKDFDELIVKFASNPSGAVDDDQLEEALQEMSNFYSSKDRAARKFFTRIDFCAWIPLCNPTYLFRVAQFFQMHRDVFLAGCLCTVLITDNQALRSVVNMFLKFYTKTRPVYIVDPNFDVPEAVRTDFMAGGSCFRGMDIK